MIEEEFRVGDLVKPIPSMTSSRNNKAVFSIKRIINQFMVSASVIRHNDPALIGKETYVYKPWLCRASIKSKFERREALCK